MEQATNIIRLLAPRLVAQVLILGEEVAQTHRPSTVGGLEEVVKTCALKFSGGNRGIAQAIPTGPWHGLCLWGVYSPRTPFKQNQELNLDMQ